MTRDRESGDVEKIREHLWRPPKGVAATAGPWSADEEAAGFSALKADLGQ